MRCAAINGKISMMKEECASLLSIAMQTCDYHKMRCYEIVCADHEVYNFHDGYSQIVVKNV